MSNPNRYSQQSSPYQVPASSNNNNQLVDIGTPSSGVQQRPDAELDSELEFQNFVLSQPVSGKVSKNNNNTPIFDSSNPYASPTMGNASSNIPNNMNTNNNNAANLNAQKAANASFWHLEYYSKYFDVDTQDVLYRLFASLLPYRNFLDVISGNPDLYGPFWIPTTVVFALFVSSGVAKSIAYSMNSKTEPAISYDILPQAVGTVYTYAGAVPIIVWLISRYFKIPIKFLELMSLYGYGLAIWVPVSLLCIIPSEFIRWILVLVAFSWSALFMLRNLYPIASRSSAKGTPILLGFMIAAHVTLIFIYKFLFFGNFVTEEQLNNGGVTPTTTSSPTPTTSMSMTATPTS